MTIVADVETHLGRTLTEVETRQVALWEGWLRADIARRLPAAEALNPEGVNRAIVQSIAAYMDNPSTASQVSVQVDDASVTRRYESGWGRIQILPHLWAELGWSEAGGAFTIIPARP